MSKKVPIPIVDLFAGPGGLGEGFSSVVDEHNNRCFRIALSIECDEHAHQTLTLRSFVRQFPHKQIPDEYYEFLRGNLLQEQLYNLYPQQTAAAKDDAWRFKLGQPNTHTLIDKRIKKVIKEHKNFIVIGGPPCQAYSLVGRARRQEVEGLNKEDERVYLYREYYRILAVHRPAVFIMENVKGILSSKIESHHIFHQIISDLQDPIRAYKKLKGQQTIYRSKINYNIFSLANSSFLHDLFGIKSFTPNNYVIKAEDYGIPQARHRVILLGIRSDIHIQPQTLEKLNKLISVEKVLNGLPQLRSGLSKAIDNKDEWFKTLQEIRNFGLDQTIDKDVLSKMFEILDKISVPDKDRGGEFIKDEITIDYMPKWFLDQKIKGVINHKTRTHIKEDLYRYLFASCFADVKNRSPKLSDFPQFLLPKHLNIQAGLTENKFADRFRVQLNNEPSKTITSHISKDGHYYIHPDPNQCRSLTVREAARIQTFPDNYFFCGPRTEQYHQVGNAVPPYLAYQIAHIVKSIMQQIPTF